MTNFFNDNDDLRFHFDRGIDWEPLVTAVEAGFKMPDGPANWKDAVETYRQVLELVGDFSAEEVAPKAAAIEKEGVRLENGEVRLGPTQEAIFGKLKDLGLFGVNVPREMGGLNGPTLMYFLTAEVMGRADASVMVHFAFHAGIAAILLDLSLREGSTTFNDKGQVVSTRWQAAVDDIVAGRAWGCMDLTESNAGSDLAALRAKAVKGADGVWRINGSKVFITSGHAQYHLVLAKTADRATLDALSLFLVPARIERDGQTIRNVKVDRLEEKMGQHGSVTAQLSFDDAEGELVGKEGEGFRLMLYLMNNARIGVGFESLGAMEAAYRMAVAFAAERKSMGKPIAQHELIAGYLDEMDVTIRGLRALAIDGAYAEDMATRLEVLWAMPGANPTEEDRKKQARFKRRARMLTPLIKYAAAEAVVWLTRTNMQIHGGYGYTVEYGAERLLRDALVMPIYEGTSQVQALMALKDHLQDVMKDPQRFLRKLADAKVRAVRARDDLDRALNNMRFESCLAQQHIVLQLAKGKWTQAVSGGVSSLFQEFKHWDPRKDFSYGLLHAEHLVRILTDVVVAEILVDQAKRFPERRELAERWVEYAAPRVRYNHDLITRTGNRLLASLAQSQKA
jgi:hypothetical protein